MSTLELETGVVRADPVATWAAVDHICRHCLSRVLTRTDDDRGTVARCSGCDIEAIGCPEALCFCGALSDKFRVGLRCVRNDHRTAETPAAIVVIESTADSSKVGPAGVSYLSMEGCARRFFRCEAYRATMSTTACAERWRQAQHAIGYDADRFLKCRDCRIGAAHAGAAFVHRSKLYGLEMCPRCRRGGSRVVCGRLCVSCYNRNLDLRRAPTEREPRLSSGLMLAALASLSMASTSNVAMNSQPTR